MMELAIIASILIAFGLIIWVCVLLIQTIWSSRKRKGSSMADVFHFYPGEHEDNKKFLEEWQRKKEEGKL